MIPAEILEYLQKIEKKQLEQEKVMIGMKRKIEELQNQLAMKNLIDENGEENVEQLDTSKYEQPKDLSLLSVQDILRYLDANKRLVLSIEYPDFRKIEKSVPLKLGHFRISPTFVSVDGVCYSFKNDHKICTFQEDGELPVNVTANGRNEDSFKKSVSKFVYNLFAGRINLDVFDCRICFCLPFELNIGVGHALLSPVEGLAKAYCNTIREVNTVSFIRLETLEDLKYQWVRSAKVLYLLYRGTHPFHQELPNLSANSIYIHFHANANLCIATILKWCENKSRPLGSQLVLTAQQPQDLNSIQTVLSSRQLVKFGFVMVANGQMSLPMNNNLEVRLTVRDGNDQFKKWYLSHCTFRSYMTLEVVHL